MSVHVPVIQVETHSEIAQQPRIDDPCLTQWGGSTSGEGGGIAPVQVNDPCLTQWGGSTSGNGGGIAPAPAQPVVRYTTTAWQQSCVKVAEVHTGDLRYQ